MQQQSILVDRLTSLRGTIRLRLVAYGICSVLAGGVCSYLTALTLDWVLWLPGALRLMIALIFVVGFVGAAIHWIAKPLRAPLGLEQIAGRLERRFVHLRDKLVSAVHFVQQGGGDSEAMMRHVVAETDLATRGMSFKSALSWRPLVIRAIALAISAVVLSSLAVAVPDWLHTGMSRYMDPFGAVAWPRRVCIVPLTFDQTVAMGESVTVRMEIVRGAHSELRALVHIKEADGSTTSQAMRCDADGYSAVIDTVTRDLTYWFEAGDDSTAPKPFAIRAVRRPEVVEALVLIEPPPYVDRMAPAMQDLEDGSVRATLGGNVTLHVRVSKPIHAEPDEKAAVLRFATGESVPLLVDPTDGHRLTARLDVVRDITFRVQLRGVDGLENRGATAYSILAVPDEPPTVTIIEPRSIVDITPDGSVRLLVRSRDDFDVVQLVIGAERLEGNETFTVPLTQQLAHRVMSGGVEAAADHTWSIAPMSLSPGDQILYAAVASDNFPGADGTGQTGRSAALRLRIISQAEFEVRLRDDLARLETHVRRATLDQADLIERTGEMMRRAQAEGSLTSLERDAVRSAAGRQDALVRRIAHVATRFDALVRRMNANASRDASLREVVATTGTSLQRISEEPMTRAGSSLRKAAETGSLDDRRDALAKADAQERKGLQGLRSLLISMSHWGHYQGLIARTRDFMDRQEELRRQTAKLGRSMLGKPVDSLTPEELEAIKRLQRRQDQLAADVEELLARMQELVDETATKDPSGAEAIEDGLRAASAHDLTRRQRAASEAIGSNRTAAAVLDQKAATDAIRRMMSALRRRESRELERLRKHVEEGARQVEALIEDQTALRMATHEADLLGAAANVFIELGKQQARLKRNALALGASLAAVERADDAARLVRQSAKSMEKAAAHLQGSEAGPATDAQDEALINLNGALLALQRLKEEAEEEQLQRSLAEIREGLEAIRSQQTQVNSGISQLRDAVAERGRVGRRGGRAASNLARQQAHIRRMVDEMLPDLQRVAVYEWALKRVVEWMETCRSSLTSRRIDGSLVHTAQRIVDELDNLIQAIEATQAMPMKDAFAGGSSSGGGRGKAVAGKPVPTIAELLVLKSMQADIMERTSRFHESVNVDDASEDQLRELRRLGEDQAEVGRLCDLVVRQAAQR